MEVCFQLFSEPLAQLGGLINHLSNQAEAVDDGGYRSVGQLGEAPA